MGTISEEKNDSPRGYVDAMSNGQIWRTENGYLNAILVSVFRNERFLLEQNTKRGITFHIVETDKKIFLRRGSLLVGIVSYKSGQPPRVVATRIIRALEGLDNKIFETKTQKEVSTTEEKPLVFKVQEDSDSNF